MQFPRLMFPCATVLLALAIACGPTASPQHGGGEKDADKPNPTASPTTSALSPISIPTAEAPTPEPIDATADPNDPENKPPQTPPFDKPAQPPRPTSTRPPGDPPADTPTPWIPSTSVPAPLPNPIREHPDGVEGCKTLNMFIHTRSEILYMAWCGEALFQDVRENCKHETTTAEQRACGVERLKDVDLADLREHITPCAAITNDQEYEKCYYETLATYGAHLKAYTAAYNKVVQVVEDNSEVKERYMAMNLCVRDAGYEPPDPAWPLSWQQIDDTMLDMKAIEAIRSANPEERAERDRRLRVINQCALDEGLYDAQDSAWLETISTMPKTDPEGAKALKEAGVVSALELEGPAPFLTIRAFTR